MKISKEVKTGILALLSIFMVIYGYSFLKGSNLFSSERTFHVSYDNVAGLSVSAPVTINGFAIGQVKNIDFQGNTGKLLVTFTLKDDFEFSKNSIVRIYSTSFIGGNALEIIPEIDPNNVAEDGDTLNGEVEVGMLDTVKKALRPLETRIYQTMSGLDTLLYNFNYILSDSTKKDLTGAIASLNKTLNNFEGVSGDLNSLLKENKPKLDSTFTYLETTTENLASFTDSLSQVDVKAMAANLEATLDSFDLIMKKIDNGEGSIGKLVNDEQLYNNLEGASKELEELLKDLKEHPKRYVNVSVFGKKEKPYQPTEEPKN